MWMEQAQHTPLCHVHVVSRLYIGLGKRGNLNDSVILHLKVSSNNDW